MRLLVVEDDIHVAGALSELLSRHGFEIVHAGNAKDALQVLLPDDAQPFSVILLDLGLPDQDGYQVCARIRERTRTPVIMLTARSDVRSRIRGLNLGADDYVVKPYSVGELLARIHAVSRRTEPVGGAERGGSGLRLGPVHIDLLTHRVTVGGSALNLTRKEFELLALLAQRPGVVFRREQIISKVWQSSSRGTGHTLEVHVSSLRTKLGSPALVETVRGVGYRLVVPTS
ncbi:response regulator transcription factor [Streptomyces scopuliridis]